MINRNSISLQALDLLRFPLAVVVVVIHTFPWWFFVGDEGNMIVTAVTAETAKYPLLAAICAFVDGFIKSQAVPIFFFISGFVFFLGIELTKEQYIRKLKNRVKSLLIPYFIWNTIGVILAIIMGYFGCFGCERWDFTWQRLLLCYWYCDGSYLMNLPLWFVRDLMIVVLFTPLIWWILRHTRYYFVVLLGIIWFVSAYFYDDFFYYRYVYIFLFFSFGAYMSINRKDILIEFGKYFRSSMIVYPLLGVLYIASVYVFERGCLFIIQLNVFAGLIFAYNIAVWLLKRKICKVSPFLSSASFFIFVTHIYVVRFFLFIYYHLFHPTTDISYICESTMVTVLTIGTILAVFWMLRKYCPKLLKVVNGSR